MARKNMSTTDGRGGGDSQVTGRRPTPQIRDTRPNSSQVQRDPGRKRTDNMSKPNQRFGRRGG